MPLKLHQDDLPQLNLTSMIDVVFLLIIFFMVAAKFSDDEKSIDMQLPKVGAAAPLAAPPKAREVAVHADGRLSLDKQDVSVDQLKTLLAAAIAQAPDAKVVIRGDAACPFQHIADAMAACKEAGVSELGINVRVAQAVASAPR